MSLQRGENVRGWEGVTRNMTLGREESAASIFGKTGLIVVFLIVAAAALRLYQADFSDLARVPLLVALLIFLLALIFRIFLTMEGKGELVEVEHSTRASAGAAEGAALARAAEQERQRAEAEAQAATARAAEEQAAAARAAEEKAAAAARAANLERERAEAEARAEAAAKAAAEEASAKAAAEKRQADAAEAARQKAEADATAATAASAPSGPDRDGDGVVEGADEGSRPEALDGPRGGQPDDLKLIKGVGPKLEALCNSLGFWHFDQISNWTADEVAWVDSNLEGFKGRVSRDNWVAQAKILASGETTEFAERQKDS